MCLKISYPLVEYVLKIEQAVAMLYKLDYLLVQNSIHELAIAGRLMHYLIPLFQSFDVDMEYDKIIVLEKKKMLNGKTIRPDIIIHKRNSDKNLIMIEIKKSNDLDKIFAHDIHKLKSCTTKGKANILYQYGAMIIVSMEGAKVSIYSEGKKRVTRCLKFN